MNADPKPQTQTQTNTMKTRFQLCRRSLATLLLFGTMTAAKADVFVEVDPGATWIGYMNVFNLPADGGGYLWGSGWGVPDLNATFSSTALTLTPNTSISRDVPLTDTYWWKTDGSGNKTMDANLYVQNDALAGETVNFSGVVLANSLVSPYTSTIFIKDFAADYSSFTSVSAPVAPGAFNLILATAAGHHIQYGFETIGPNARLDEVAGLGVAEIAVIPEPSAAVLLLGGMLAVLFRRHS
jgi:hypothetical protein